MRSEFNLLLDMREDGTKVFVAKCKRCDAVIVGEQANEVPIVRSHAPIPPAQIATLNRQMRRAWEEARKGGFPVLIPDPNLEVVAQPDHGLQHALDAHVEVCK